MHVVWNGYGFREMVTWLSRITHCRGFGVQSPSAYRFIRYVVNEHYPYYAYADLREKFPYIGSTDEKLCRLYFRIANYQQPMTFINIGKSEGIKSSHAAREIWKSMMNDSRTGVTFDLYYCGILFFDKRIKQNYIVNF